MTKIYRWVIEFRWVSSKNKTKLFSIIFVLLFGGIAFFSSVISLKISIASDITIDNVVSLTNQSRKETGKSALVVNYKLSRAAEKKASDMINNNYFSHTSPTGVTPWDWIKRENYSYSYAGENLAMDFRTAERMEEAWMASPTHRANILNEKYTEIGVAVKEGVLNGHQTILVVVMFGSGDKNLLTTVDNAEKNISKAKEENKEEKSIPILFAGTERKNGFAIGQPVITIPRAGEKLSKKEIRIIGRAKPAETIEIFDNNNFIGSAVADLDGWFSLIDKGLSNGSHQLSLKSGGIYKDFEREFFVDQEKPEVNFRLYASKNNFRQFFLEVNASKDNCMLRFNRETRIVSRGESVIFVINSGEMSAVLRISDQAGNSNFRQINLVNYYFGDDRKNLTEEIASVMFSNKNIFAIDPGRETIRNNIRFAIRGLNNNY